MPNSGDEIVVSQYQRLRFVQTAAETGGELLQVVASYRPESPRPPAHYHPHQRESFEVRRGKFRVQIAGQEALFQTGQAFEVPAGAVHWMHNVASEKGELLWEIRPALKTEYFFATFWNLDRKTASSGVEPGLLQFAVLLPEFYDEFRLAQPPFALQKLLFGLLAPIGRARGYPDAAALARSA